MRLSELQNKDIVNINNGSKIGKIIDVLINIDGNMEALIVQKNKIINVFSNNGEFELKWNQIKKIGDDVILVNL